MKRNSVRWYSRAHVSSSGDPACETLRGPSLHVRSSGNHAYEVLRGPCMWCVHPLSELEVTHEEAVSCPWKYPRRFWASQGCLGGMCPFSVSCVTWGLVTGFDFSISHFLSEEDAREKAPSLHTLHAGNEKSLKPWEEQRSIMLSLGWLFLCFVAGEQTTGFDHSGRGFCFAC